MSDGWRCNVQSRSGVHLSVERVIVVLAEEHAIVVRVVTLRSVERVVMDVVSVANIVQEVVLVRIHRIIVLIILIDHPVRFVCLLLLT